MDENGLLNKIIGAAIEVHRALGPGLLEAIYESAMCLELQSSGLLVERQKPMSVFYKGQKLEGTYRIDMLVNGLVIVELKAVETVLPVHEAQLLSYLRLANKRLGLLMNFNDLSLARSVRRVVNNL